MSGELTGDLITKWINFKLYPESIEDDFFSPGVLLACLPSQYHCVGSEEVQKFLRELYSMSSTNAQVEILEAKMDIQENTLIEHAKVSISFKANTLEWLLPQEHAHVDIKGKKITNLALDMILQFSDDMLVKINIEWDPMEVESQVLPPKPEIKEEEKVTSLKPAETVEEKVVAAEQEEETPAFDSEKEIKTGKKDNDASQAIEPKAPITSTPAKKTESVNLVEEEKQPVGKVQIEPEQISELSLPNNSAQKPIAEEILPKADEPSVDIVITSQDPVSTPEEPATHLVGEHAEVETLIDSEISTPNMSASPTQFKAIKKDNSDNEKKKKSIGGPMRRSVTQLTPRAAHARSSSTQQRSVPVSPPAVARRPTSQASFRSSTSSSSAKSQPTRNSRMAILPPLNPNRKFDPQRLKSQIEISHDSVAKPTISSGLKATSLTSVPTVCHSIPTRREISARHLATNFTIGNEEPSSPGSAPTSARSSETPAWAKELRPYLNKGSTSIRL